MYLKPRAKPEAARAAVAGFGLIEVMISLVIIAVGLLGIEKMEALAYASTGIASGRAIAAIEAESLAAEMHANRAFWAAGAAPAYFYVSGVTVTDPTSTVNVAGAACSTASGATNPAACTPAIMAAFDVEQWAAALQALLPNDGAYVTCTTSVITPVNCTITVSWAENNVSINAQGTIAQNSPSYTLYVEP
jgi:type IV pilus assembly protein PilV